MKKPKKGEADSIFGSIRQTSAPIQDPLEAKPFRSADGERMTKVSYRLNPIPVVASADKLMKAAGEIPSVLIYPNLWHFILPWLDSSNGRIRKFWQCYRCEAAEAARKVAIEGSKSCNRQNEQNLLRIVHEFKALSIKSYGYDLSANELPSVLAAAASSEAERDDMMHALKEKMVDWVLNAIWTDPEAPKRLHELLTNKTAAQSEYADQPGWEGRFFNAFVQEITEHWRLPTKKAVRTRAGWGDRPISDAADLYAAIGLSGLPQS